jgi:outer membrane protein OmpA-like peptidoglycan-associated protein
MPAFRRFSALLMFTILIGTAGFEPASSQTDAPSRIDYVTAARGAWLVSISVSGAEKGPSRHQAFETYDGLTTPRAMAWNADPDAQVVLVYALPAMTIFDRFAVPEVSEVPSAYVTFFRQVEVLGSASGNDRGFELLAKATLETHQGRGLVTDLELVAEKPVRFLKLVLRGGINDLAEKMGYQFSELIANGRQETVPPEEGFTGIWDTKLPDIDRSAGLIELKQDGVAVTGCYVSTTITGTVSGNILRAQGLSPSDTPSQYVLLLDSDGALRGTANSNNGPFNLFGGPVAQEGTTTDCSDIPNPELGCGSTIYVQFEFDSAELRAESEPILSDLFDGLQASVGGTIVIEGHTSSEGSEQYNRDLSARRGQAVVDDLVRRGIGPARIRAVGKGELEPIATNKDEAGRSLNRRVEVECGG